MPLRRTPESPVLKPVEILLEAFLETLKDCGVKESAALPRAKRIVDQFLIRMGGGVVYLPKGYDYTREAREARNITIQEQYNAGAKVPDLSRSFRLTPKQIYQILKKRRKA